MSSDYCSKHLLQPWLRPAGFAQSWLQPTDYAHPWLKPNFFEIPYVVNLTNLDAKSLMNFCGHVSNCETDEAKCNIDSLDEVEFSKPMVLIGIYIAVASSFCILAMALDLLNGFRNRKFWFPTKYFSLNAASITVITVAMKLPVDLSSPMPRTVDIAAKIGGLAFMCTIMSNLMPSLASMDNKSLLANVTGLSILVITLIANIFIQIRTHLIDVSIAYYARLIPFSMVMAASINMGMLIFLLIIFISSSLTIPASKRILEAKYRATSKTILNEYQQENLKPSEKLIQLVTKFWVISETGSPQFVIASNTLSTASAVICATSMAMHIVLVCGLLYLRRVYITRLILDRHYPLEESVYKKSTIVIVTTQSIGILLGSIAPICRCFTVLIFKPFDKQNRNQLLVFKVEKYWTEKLSEWKEIRINILSSSRRSRALLHNLKNRILSFCIGFQKVIIVSCKIIGLLPIVAINFVMCWLRYFKSLKAKLFGTTTVLSSHNTEEGLRDYTLSLEDNTQLAEKTMKGILDSMNSLIRKAKKKHHNNILKLLEESVSFDGVETFDTNQIQSPLSVELVNSWSLPIISLTCIAAAIPNINMDRVNNLVKSVTEGLLYTHLVEKSLNREYVYVNIQRATVTLWHEVEDNCKWLETTLERSVYQGKTPTEILIMFVHIAEEILNEFNRSTNGETVDNENLPLKVIAANSMYRIAKTIIHTYETQKREMFEDDLFTRLSVMIADILAACLTNIPRVIIMRCQESAIEKLEASVEAAIDLLGRSTEIIKKLETREVPNVDHDKMGFIDEWRLHLRQP